jgi:vancomycin resistance protein VanJ
MDSDEMTRLRTLISIFTGGYALGLAAYLLVRVLVRDGYWLVAFLNNFTPYYFLPLLIFVPLALIVRAKRGLLLMLPFALLGLVWFGPRFLPKTASAQASGETLKVITYNVLHVNHRLDEIEAWLREQEADVVLLQEMTTEQFPGQLDDVYPNQPDYPADLAWWGNVSFSRYPITSVDPVDVDRDAFPGYQRFVIDANGMQIAVYNVHFRLPTGDVSHLGIENTSSGLFNVAMYYNATRRNAQIARLLTQVESETLPYVVAGDFNTSDNAIIYGDLAAHMHDSFREAGTGFGASWPLPEIINLPPFLPPILGIDYVWHSDAFHAVSATQGPRLGSDHLPLVATLALNGAESPSGS